MRTRWRNRLADAGQSETCNQLPMPEATSICVEMTNLQGLADLERLEGCRQVLQPRISSLRCEQSAAPRSIFRRFEAPNRRVSGGYATSTMQ